MSVVIITGSSRGIGRATAILFARKGHNVVVNYNTSKSQAYEVIDEIQSFGRKCMAVKADVSDYSQVNQMVKQVKEKFGAIDILINNAAVSLIKQIQDTTQEEFDRLFAINVRGVFNCTKAVIEYMIANKSGSIVNISSIWGQMGASCESVYSATKGAVNSFTKSVAQEVGRSGIRVNAVSAGLVNTQMNNQLSGNDIKQFIDNVSLARMGNVNEIANVIYMLASDESSYINGQIINADGGIF